MAYLIYPITSVKQPQVSRKWATLQNKFWLQQMRIILFLKLRQTITLKCKLSKWFTVHGNLLFSAERVRREKSFIAWLSWVRPYLAMIIKLCNLLIFIIWNINLLLKVTYFKQSKCQQCMNRYFEVHFEKKLSIKSWNSAPLYDITFAWTSLSMRFWHGWS